MKWGQGMRVGRGCLGKSLGLRPGRSEGEPYRYPGKGVPGGGTGQGKGLEGEEHCPRGSLMVCYSWSLGCIWEGGRQETERPGEQVLGVKGFVKPEEDSGFSPGSRGCYGKAWLINAKQQP